jgi:hypothetical protein
VYTYVILEPDETYHVAAVPISGGPVTHYKESPEQPSIRLSPDGGFILGLFSRTPGGTRDLLAIPLDGGPERNLSAGLETAGPVDTYVTTPDSRYVVVATSDTGSGRGLFKIPVEGGRPAPLATSLPGELNLRFLDVGSDGMYVLYSLFPEGRETADLFSAPLSGGSPRRLCGAAEALISPDNELVLCPSGEVVPIAGGAPLDITGGDGEMNWNVFEQPVFVYSGEDKRIVWSTNNELSTQGPALFVSVLRENGGEH